MGGAAVQLEEVWEGKMKFVKYSLRFVVLLFLVLQHGSPEMSVAQKNRPVVVLDPGHGWSNASGNIDPGAVSGDLIEKDIALDVARHTRTFLNRCPVDVFLTREGDDPEHTLLDVDEIVNSHQPTVGISIHVNSAGAGATGAEGWYTVGGYDDTGSQQLAALLSASIATHFSIPDRGAKPETSNRHGSLYIHHWQTPSALVEVGFLQGDAALLRERRPDFGRAIAQATLVYLGLPVTCADAAVSSGLAVATYFPGDTKVNQVNLLNDGLGTWQVGDYTLKNVRNQYGAETDYPLSTATAVGEIASWAIPATAPSRPGVYRQVWQLHRGNDAIDPEVAVVLIVVPEEARELKEDIDRQIEEWRERGEEELEKWIDELEEKAIEWATREIERQAEQCLGPNAMIVGLVIGATLWRRIKKRPYLSSDN